MKERKRLKLRLKQKQISKEATVYQQPSHEDDHLIQYFQNPIEEPVDPIKHWVSSLRHKIWTIFQGATRRAITYD